MWAGGWCAPSADVGKVWSVCHCVSVDSCSDRLLSIFFLCVFCPLVAQVRALLCFLIVRWMRSIAPSVQSNIAPSAYCVSPGFLFVAIPPLHSLSLLIYGPWWVPAVARRCLDVLLLFLQVIFLFGGGSGAVIYSPDGWPFVWDGVIWGPQQVCVSVWVSFLICLYSDVTCAVVLYFYVLGFFASSSCVKVLPGYLIKLSLPDVWKKIIIVYQKTKHDCQLFTSPNEKRWFSFQLKLMFR